MTDENVLTPLAAALADYINASDLGFAAFGKQIGTSGDRVSKWVKGLRDVSIEEVWSIEEHLNIPHGYFLRKAGYVEEKSAPMPLRNAILTADELTPSSRKALLAVLEALDD